MDNAEAIRILIVDDNEANRYTLARHLRRAGYEVREAKCGTEALETLSWEPHVLILDVKLPDMNGLDISRKLREDPATRHIPILQVSATYILSADKVRGLDAGADAYLSGPVEPEELLANVRMLLRLRSANVDLYMFL
jgi:CheY-like chemotaxis protein